MKKLLALLLFISSYLSATSVTLQGTFKQPNLSGVTGILYMSVTQQAAVSSSGSCGGPFQVVPTVQISITVTNGVVTPTSLEDNNCMSPAGVQYNAVLKDSGGNLLFSDTWLVTCAPVNNCTLDVGTVVDTTGNVGLALAGIVQTSPSGAQTITQPGSTSLTINGSGSPLVTINGLTQVSSLIVGGDTAFSASPRMIWSGFNPATFGSANGSWGTMTFDKPVTITGITVNTNTASSGCSTVYRFGVIGIVDVALPNGNTSISSLGLNSNLPAGSSFSIGQTNTASGCGSSPTNIMITVQYKMQ